MLPCCVDAGGAAAYRPATTRNKSFYKTVYTVFNIEKE
jgi:hypothetical protein